MSHVTLTIVLSAERNLMLVLKTHYTQSVLKHTKLYFTHVFIVTTSSMNYIEDTPIPLELEDRWNWLPARVSGEETQCHIPSTTKHWRRLSSSPSESASINPDGRCSHTLTALSDECLLLVGGGSVLEGEENFHHFADVWVLSALTAKWKELEPITQPPKEREDSESDWGMTFGPPRRGHVAAAYQSKYLLVFGGVTNDDVELNDLWILNVHKRQWKRIARGDTVPPPRRAGVACCYKDHFYIVGGHASEEMVVWKLGPLSSSEPWRWSIQTALNKTFLHKRAPKWPTISLGARPLQPIQFTASTIV